jgi:hypothetical protein
MQVTPTSIHLGSASNKFQSFSHEADNTDNDTHMTRDRKSFFSHISAASSWRLLAGTIQVQQGILGMPIHQYFQRHTRTTQQCTTRLLRTTRDSKEPSHTSHHLMENSWNHHGEANVTASLHRCFCDARPHLRMEMYLYHCSNSKHYHIYRANCLAVVGVITGVRIEWHKLQSQQW